MAEYTCTITDAVVRGEDSERLESLIQKMFARRHHDRVSAGPSGQMWLTVELVQALRRKSEVYRELSTKTRGPLPFEIGYLRVREGRLESISNSLRIDSPEVFVRLVSEFVEPGANISLEPLDDAADVPEGGTWTVVDKGEVEKVD